MTEAEFLAVMRQIGLDPAAHDMKALHTAYERLTDLFAHLETDEARDRAQALPVFDPQDPF